jgi:hypothetical protein
MSTFDTHVAECLARLRPPNTAAGGASGRRPACLEAGPAGGTHRDVRDEFIAGAELDLALAALHAQL